MTRINLIPPSELHRKHLGAEYYELPEIFRLVHARQERGHKPSSCPIPPTYRFGTGHKLFFYDKLLWLSYRYDSLVEEMRNRGYWPDPIRFGILYDDLEPHWWGDWEPSPEEINLSRERIQQRVKELGLT